jgi:ABC-type uncharacterized transport system substrate-binding protein
MRVPSDHSCGRDARDDRTLSVESSTSFYRLINLKTAKSFGLDVPPMLLARADEVIE